MQYINPDIESSYRENDLGRTLYDLVLEKKPNVIAEFGILHGYSTVAMAMALDELGAGHLFASDLFDKYEYKHGSKTEVQRELEKYGVAGYVTLQQKDFYEWLEDPTPFDLLHVDISNKGDTIQKMHEKLKRRIQEGATVVFEGGSQERDTVEWMIKYHQPKIGESGIPYKVLNNAFPSLSMLLP